MKKIKKTLQTINRYLLFTNIVLINTIVALNVLNADIINNVIDTITVIY